MKELKWIEKEIQMTKHHEIRNPAYIGQNSSLIGTITLQREILIQITRPENRGLR
jgi:hypothetical protein